MSLEKGPDFDKQGNATRLPTSREGRGRPQPRSRRHRGRSTNTRRLCSEREARLPPTSLRIRQTILSRLQGQLGASTLERGVAIVNIPEAEARSLSSGVDTPCTNTPWEWEASSKRKLPLERRPGCPTPTGPFMTSRDTLVMVTQSSCFSAGTGWACNLAMFLLRGTTAAFSKDNNSTVPWRA